MQSVSSNAVALSLASKNNLIKYKEVNLQNITIGQAGYVSISSYFPSGMNNFLFCLVYDYGSTMYGRDFDVNADGRYIRGLKEDTIDRITLRYYYTD